MTRDGTEWIRKTAIAFLLLPFFLLSLFSNTVMPVRTADGFVLVICTGEGPLEVTIDRETGAPIEEGPDRGSDRCDWASATPLVTLFSSAELLAQQVDATGLALPIPPAHLVASHATGLPPATGPPAVL